MIGVEEDRRDYYGAIR